MVAGEVDSLDPQRSYLPGVWNLMRLYTRTLVTYAHQAGAHRRARARPRHRPRHEPRRRADLDLHTCARACEVRDRRPITSQDVKYGIERSFASDVVVGGPTYVVDLLDDPGDPYAGPLPGRQRRTSSA